MKVVIDPGEQLLFKPIRREIREELTFREGNKDYVHNLTPFVRVSCLQEVSYRKEEKLGKGNDLRAIEDSVLVDATRFDGFQFRFTSDFEESYGEVQKIGNTLDNKSVNIRNPRRVPPPALTSFTANVGEGSDYFTSAQLNFTCNSLEQLQFLVPFLFNPGNGIFVEFGHNTEAVKNKISLFDADDAKALVDSTIVKLDCNQAESEGFIERMNKRVFESGGAYDYFYGIINNFDFTMNDALGYDCTVDMIAASKMKLQAPNVNNNNDIGKRRTSIRQRIKSRTLSSELKTFEDILYGLNEELDKDRIFSFSDTDSTTYVRLDDIFGFLNGEYSNEGDTVGDTPALSGSVYQRINGQNKTYDNIIGNEKYITVKKANYENGEPPIVSYSSDVLLFRKEMWNPNISYDDTVASYVIDVGDLRDDFVDGSTFLADSLFNVTNIPPEYGEGTATRILDSPGLNDPSDRFIAPRTEERLRARAGKTKVTTKFEYIKPYLLDEHKNPKFENLYNAYINFSKFKSIYLASEGKALDTMKRLADIINNATGGMWNIQLVGDAVTIPTDNEKDEGTECEKVISTYISADSGDVDRTEETYTFKASSKGSVFTGMGYDLGLEGLLGDQIYMNSLNAPDGSADSQKLNLLLFSNHENNLVINDKRNSRIYEVWSEIGTEEGSNEITVNDARLTEEEFRLIQREVSNDIKNDFFGRYAVGRPESSGQLPPQDSFETIGSLTGATLARQLANAIREGNNSIGEVSQHPLDVKLTDLRDFYIPYSSPTARPVRNDRGEQIDFENVSIPPFDREDIVDGVLALYNAERIPLVFEPVKAAIDNLRAQTNINYQPNGEKNTAAGRQERDIRERRSFSAGGINPLLESKLELTMPGIGGINPLEYVKVSGIPDVYAERGEFCIMDVAHSITPTAWETQISTRFRVTPKDE